jgi:hypothetical protein
MLTTSLNPRLKQQRLLCYPNTIWLPILVQGSARMPLVFMIDLQTGQHSWLTNMKSWSWRILRIRTHPGKTDQLNNKVTIK